MARQIVPVQVTIVVLPVVLPGQAITVVVHQGALLVAAVQVTAVAVLLVVVQAIIAVVLLQVLQVHAQVIVVALLVVLPQEALAHIVPVVLLQDVLQVEDHTVAVVVEVVADADNTMVS